MILDDHLVSWFKPLMDGKFAAKCLPFLFVKVWCLKWLLILGSERRVQVDSESAVDSRDHVSDKNSTAFGRRKERKKSILVNCN